MSPSLHSTCYGGAAAAVMVLLLGCATQGDPQPSDGPAPTGMRPVTTPKPPTRNLEQLKAEIMTNAAGLRTLKADCRVTIQSPKLAAPRREGALPALTLNGQMAIAVPRRVKLYLEATGKTLVEITGDGNQYVVDMPGIGPSKYRGAYDSAFVSDPRRIPMLPDDIATAFDQNNLFADQSLVLKAYPDYWIIEGIRVLTDPVRVTIPASFWIQREETSEDNPAMIQLLTKFDSSGEVRSTISLRDYRPIPDPEHGVLCSLPHLVQITYPSDRTVITIRISDVVLNGPLRPGVFDTQSPPAERSSVTRVAPGR